MPDRYLWLSLILSFVGGFSDAGSFVVLGSFTGHITGTAMLLAVNVTDARWAQALSCLLAIVAFLVGTTAGVAWPHEPGHSASRRLAPVLATELLLVALGLALPALGATGRRDGFLVCLCLALGLQNGALGKIGSVAFHTTFITGLSTTLVSAVVAGKPDPKRKLLPPIIACFILGAFAGAFSASRAGVPGFALVLVLLAAAWVVAVTDRAAA